MIIGSARLRYLLLQPARRLPILPAMSRPPEKPWNAGKVLFPELQGGPKHEPPRPLSDTVTTGHSTSMHGSPTDRCPECGSASKGAYPGKLCDHRWHTSPRPGEVPVESVGLIITQLPDEPSEEG